MKNDCFYCENGEKLHSLMIPICELKYSNVYLNRDQKHRGRCIVEFKDHKTEYFQLTEEENAGYFSELAKVAKAIWDEFHPDKIIMQHLAMVFRMYMYMLYQSIKAV